MENFDLETNIPPKDDGALDMSVSSICRIDGRKKAYVNFSGGKRTAEGLIPDCKITKNNGFSKEEVAALEEYMKKELETLKKMAAEVNVMKAFMEP